MGSRLPRIDGVIEIESKPVRQEECKMSVNGLKRTPGSVVLIGITPGIKC
jgi:hypothetical protein